MQYRHRLDQQNLLSDGSPAGEGGVRGFSIREGCAPGTQEDCPADWTQARESMPI